MISLTKFNAVFGIAGPVAKIPTLFPSSTVVFWKCGQKWIAAINAPTKAPATWAKMNGATCPHSKEPATANPIVTAGFKWPGEPKCPLAKSPSITATPQPIAMYNQLAPTPFAKVPFKLTEHPTPEPKRIRTTVPKNSPNTGLFIMRPPYSFFWLSQLTPDNLLIFIITVFSLTKW